MAVWGTAGCKTILSLQSNQNVQSSFTWPFLDHDHFFSLNMISSMKVIQLVVSQESRALIQTECSLSLCVTCCSLDIIKTLTTNFSRRRKRESTYRSKWEMDHKWSWPVSRNDYNKANFTLGHNLISVSHAEPSNLKQFQQGALTSLQWNHSWEELFLQEKVATFVTL